MPSSVGHILAGLAVSRLTGGSLREDWPFVLLAAAPDLDVVVDVIRKKPIDYRNRRSHTLGAALAAGAAAGTISRFRKGGFSIGMTKATAAYGSHLLLDYFGKEAEDGLPLLWPLTDRRIAAARPVFRTIYTRHGRFFTGLLSRRNMKKIAREIAIVTPFVIAAHLIQRAASD